MTDQNSRISREAALIAAAADQPKPVTASNLALDLQALGLARGDILVVHARLSALGWVAGGAQAVLEALRSCLGPGGTLVMPTHSGQLTDPGRWQAPAVPNAWLPHIRAELPAYDLHRTATRNMGQLAELFRQQPGVRRSGHPHVSFAAAGPQAEAITAQHLPGHAMDDQSPIGRLYAADAKVLLLGVDHGNNTSLHLAESRAQFPAKEQIDEGAPMMVAGRRQWITFKEWNWDDSDFAELGRAWEDRASLAELRIGPVGRGQARLLQQRPLVDFATNWLTAHRT